MRARDTLSLNDLVRAPIGRSPTAVGFAQRAQIAFEFLKVRQSQEMLLQPQRAMESRWKLVDAVRIFPSVVFSLGCWDTAKNVVKNQRYVCIFWWDFTKSEWSNETWNRHHIDRWRRFKSSNVEVQFGLSPRGAEKCIMQALKIELKPAVEGVYDGSSFST